MSAPTIANGCNRPINFQTGTVPDVSGALKDYFQLITFTKITKTTSGFQVIETEVTTSFWGLVQPYAQVAAKTIIPDRRAPAAQPARPFPPRAAHTAEPLRKVDGVKQVILKALKAAGLINKP